MGGLNLAPVNIRQYLHTLTGGNEGLSEKDLSESDRATLMQAVQKVMQQSGQESGTIGYGDYGDTIATHDNMGLLDLLYRSATDPAFRLETTLGMAKYNVDPQGNVIVSDQYDFNADPAAVQQAIQQKGGLGLALEGYQHSGWMGLLNALGNMARPGETGTPYSLNLGQLKR